MGGSVFIELRHLGVARRVIRLERMRCSRYNWRLRLLASKWDSLKNLQGALLVMGNEESGIRWPGADVSPFQPNRAVRGGSIQREGLNADGAARELSCRRARKRRAADS